MQSALMKIYFQRVSDKSCSHFTNSKRKTSTIVIDINHRAVKKIHIFHKTKSRFVAIRTLKRCLYAVLSLSNSKLLNLHQTKPHQKARTTCQRLSKTVCLSSFVRKVFDGFYYSSRREKATRNELHLSMRF